MKLELLGGALGGWKALIELFCILPFYLLDLEYEEFVTFKKVKQIKSYPHDPHTLNLLTINYYSLYTELAFTFYVYNEKNMWDRFWKQKTSCSTNVHCSPTMYQHWERWRHQELNGIWTQGNESDCLDPRQLKGEMTRLRDLRNVKVQVMERGRQIHKRTGCPRGRRNARMVSWKPKENFKM